jgi:DNA-binding CsgD family transcriptional regulator
MANERELTSVLGEFARDMATDFPIQRILDHLVLRIVEILPITASGVTLIEPNAMPRYVAGSDASAIRFEQLQTELGEGPCLEAYRTGTAILVPDLRREDRFAKFRFRALEAGLGAVFTFPLREGDRPLGALDLYRDTPGPLGRDDMAAAQTLADVTTAYLVNARGRDALQREEQAVAPWVVPARSSGAVLGSDAERIATLERHLIRFAAELHSGGWGNSNPAGLDPSCLLALNQLPNRQREIVDRLLRGQRVPSIAAAMYIATSTVRNHLSHVYGTFGVHSQSSLLALLRSESPAVECR